MCIYDPKKIVGAEVPKYGYKLMARMKNGNLETPYQHQKLRAGIWERPNTRKEAEDIDPEHHLNDYLNKGRFSVLIKEESGLKELESNQELWRVEIKSRSAFEGTWGWENHPVVIVNQIKLLKCVKKWSLYKRFKEWFKDNL